MSQLAKLVAVLYVFAGSLALLCWSAGDAGIATPYLDPVAKIQAQDEAVYGSSSFAMAARGGWLTPRLLDRYALSKPPLLYWLQAAWAKFSGPSVWALRLPSLLAGAGTAALVFAWLLFEADDLAVALIGAVLILSSHLFFSLSRLGVPDAISLSWSTLAIFALSRNPRLDSLGALWTFGVASGAALMTTGLPGVLPLLALALFCAISSKRPSWQRALQAVAIGLAVAAPWHLYQLSMHPRWFWAEYGSIQAPDSTEVKHEILIWFYLKKIVLLDAPLLAAALVSLARKRPPLLLVWIAAALAVALGLQDPRAASLLPVFPPLAILAAGAIPVSRAKWALALAVALFAGKLLAASQPWGIPWDPEVVNPSDADLIRYAALHRGNELIVVEPDDQFFSACLALPRVRYVSVDARPPRRARLDFSYLGIQVTAQEFARLSDLHSEFERRLREWGLDSGDPVATAIVASTEDSVGPLIRDHPDSDFFLPGAWVLRDQGIHQAWPMRGARAFLLARKMIHRP